MGFRRTQVMVGIVAAVIIGGVAFTATQGSADPDTFRANKIALLQKEQRDATARLQGPRLSDAQRADPDPALRNNAQPHSRLIYWRAACPAGPCERQTPPTADEAKSVSTNNYYLGFDGQDAWTLYAGWTISSGQGLLRLERRDGRHDLALTGDQGIPTLTDVTPMQAQFTTSTGRRGFLDLATLTVIFTN